VKGFSLFLPQTASDEHAARSLGGTGQL